MPRAVWLKTTWSWLGTMWPKTTLLFGHNIMDVDNNIMVLGSLVFPCFVLSFQGDKQTPLN